jgi:hypothetical protein
MSCGGSDLVALACGIIIAFHHGPMQLRLSSGDDARSSIPPEVAFIWFE